MSREIVKLVIKANSARQKLPVFCELTERIEELKAFDKDLKRGPSF